MKITHAVVGPMPASFALALFSPLPKITATFEDGSTKVLFDFYPDEISFLPNEFVGLTEEGAYNLKFEKDKRYLQS